MRVPIYQLFKKVNTSWVFWIESSDAMTIYYNVLKEQLKGKDARPLKIREV